MRDIVGYGLLIVFFGYISVAGFYQQMNDLEENEAIRQEQHQRIQNLEAALLRGDEILEQIYPGWDRQKPVFSKQVKVTAYTSRPEETDDTPYINASNQTVRPGTIAVSRDLLEEVGGFGSLVILAGYGTFEVADVMNRRYTNSVDIWMGDLEAARLHGPQTTQMIWQ